MIFTISYGINVIAFLSNRYGGSYVGNVPANTRLKIPAINLEDGPQVLLV
jgi:glutaredoxin-related protein